VSGKRATKTKRTKTVVGQERFVAEYLKDLNATDAIVRCGFKGKRPDAAGSRMLAMPAVQAALARHRTELEDTALVTVKEVVNEFRNVAFLDPADFYDADGNLLPVPQMPERARRALLGFEVEHVKTSRTKKGEDDEGNADAETEVETIRKVKLLNKLDALRDLGRFLKMFGDEGAVVRARVKVVDLSGRKVADVEVEADVR